MKFTKAGLAAKKILNLLGPGFITGASDDDPSGIGTYSQTGAIFGFKQLWTSVYTFPFMVVMQEMCARIGLVTGNGITSVIKQYYSTKILYPVLLILTVSNIINIGADLGAMASSAQMIAGGQFFFWLIFITIFSIVVMVAVPYNIYVYYLKFLSISLLGYIVTVFVVKQDWNLVLKSAVFPEIEWTKDYMMNIVAVLGTTISPYLFFWQANEEAEETVKRKMMAAMGEGHPKVRERHIKMMQTDTIIGMFFSNFISFFVIDAAAITLHAHGVQQINTAADAAQALRPLAGNMAYLLFAVGILGTGLMAVPVLAGTVGYAIAQTASWKQGLSLKYTEAPRFYLVIILSTLAGLFIHFFNISPFQMLYYTAILNGVAAPPLMLIIMVVSNNRKIMGEHKNHLITNITGGFITLVMTVAAVAMFIYL